MENNENDSDVWQYILGKGLLSRSFNTAWLSIHMESVIRIIWIKKKQISAYCTFSRINNKHSVRISYLHSMHFQYDHGLVYEDNTSISI